ncbi:MAG: hypothetical protein KKA67_15395 [Spirochaetes bacterium]|nr:hypothetical protein [Spirochaetota bacterium]MBU1080532.1 hypothetical protein [Spirochaetota bacterium]
MKTNIFALFTVATIVAAAPAFGAPSLTPSVSLASGAALSHEADYSAAVGAALGARLGLAIGDVAGAVIRGGASYQPATAYTAEWYRYRGFFALDLGVGPFCDLGKVTVSVVAGGHLARYDYSYSYFWFPYIEAGASLPIARLGPLFTLGAGLAVPVYLRADSFTAGIRAVVTLSYEPRADVATGAVE